jgi:hypothetical protein
VKGYRLHDERIARYGGEGSMRTIKYELVDIESYADNTAPKHLRDSIADAVFAEYRKLYGNLNLSDYLSGNTPKSVLGFWLLSLSLGVFYGESEDKLAAAFGEWRGTKSAVGERFDSMGQELRDVLDAAQWGKFMVATQRGLAGKSDTQRAQIIYNLVKPEHKKDEAKVAILRPIAERYARKIVNAPDAAGFKAELFGVDPFIQAKAAYTLTWVVDPDWEQIEYDPAEPTDLIETAIARYSRVMRSDFKAIGSAMGIGNNGNNINNILGTARKYLLEDKAGEIAKQMTAQYGFNGAQTARVKERLELLAAYAHELGEPFVTRSWSEYRGDFNGTIESWFSNRSSKQDVAREQLDSLDIALTELKQLLEDCKAIDTPTYALSEELLNVIDESRADGHVTYEESQAVRLLQGEVRSALNTWQQESGVRDNRLGKRGSIGSVLGKKVQSTPLFFGVSQKRRYQKVTHARRDALAQLMVLKDLWVQAKDGAGADALVTDRQVAALAASSQRSEVSEVRDAYARLEKLLEADFARQHGRDRYFISGFERQSGLRKLPYEPVSVQDVLRAAQIEQLLDQLKTRITAPNLLRDAMQLSKTLLAMAIFAADKAQMFKAPDTSGLTERQQKLLERYAEKDTMDRKTAELLQVYIHSELSGFAALISKRVVIERASVQAANSKQAFLAYESSGSKRRYYVKHATIAEDVSGGKQFERPLWLPSKSDNYKSSHFTEKTTPIGTFLAIKSSKYQVQFLEWLLGYISRRKTILAAGGAFTIAERTIKLDWSGDVPRAVPQGDKRLFISQPFTMEAKTEPKSVTRESKPRFMGVDIGEYGLAVNIIECDGSSVQSIHTEFLTDPQHRKLASRVKELRENQVRATFNQVNTKVARLRESLVGAYRNQLEALALRHDAYLSFEREVSGFEAGGARIAKVYDAIKRADVKKKDNNQQNNQSWGKLKADQNRWAREATAAGTSQTCSKCKRWASLLIDDGKTYKLSDHLKIAGLKIATLEGKVKVVCWPKGIKTLAGRELKGAIYAALRPPENGISLALAGIESLPEGWRAARGNMAIFICPFVDCHHVSDADMQAALNIAIRGFAKYQSDGKMAKAEEFVKFSKTLHYQPVGQRQ